MTVPIPRSQVVDLYFMEHRAKVLDIAAFLDRCDRAQADSDKEDFRMIALRKALAILQDDRPERAKRIQECFSDHSTQPIDKATMQGALGAAQS
jgi:hypothetical protein